MVSGWRRRVEFIRIHFHNELSLSDYNATWRNRDERENFAQSYETDMIKEVKRAEMESEVKRPFLFHSLLDQARSHRNIE